MKTNEKTQNLIREIFPNEWLEKTSLTFDEQRVLANLINSAYRTKETKIIDADNQVIHFIKSIPALRDLIHINREKLYTILTDFELKYGYISWKRGKKRVQGEPSQASEFTIFYKKIMETPTPSKRLDFSCFFKKSGSAVTDTDTVTVSDTVTDTEKKSEIETKQTTKQVTVSETIDNYTKIWRKIEKDLRFSGSELDEVRNEILETLDTKYGKILTHQELEKLKGEIWYFSLLQVEESEDLETVTSIF